MPVGAPERFPPPDVMAPDGNMNTQSWVLVPLVADALERGGGFRFERPGHMVTGPDGESPVAWRIGSLA